MNYTVGLTDWLRCYELVFPSSFVDILSELLNWWQDGSRVYGSYFLNRCSFKAGVLLIATVLDEFDHFLIHSVSLFKCWWESWFLALRFRCNYLLGSLILTFFFYQSVFSCFYFAEHWKSTHHLVRVLVRPFFRVTRLKIELWLLHDLTHLLLLVLDRARFNYPMSTLNVAVGEQA